MTELRQIKLLNFLDYLQIFSVDTVYTTANLELKQGLSD